MSYDKSVRSTEKFGPHQRRIFSLLCLVPMSWAFHKMGGVFLAAEPDFRCLLPHESPGNATYQVPPNITNFTNTSNYEIENWPKCERYDYESANPYNAEGEILKSTGPSTVKCDSFVYDRNQYKETATTEFNLVCDNAWKRATSDSLLMVGDFTGVLILSAMSDRYGRKPTLLIGVAIQSILGLLVAASPVFVTFVIFRTFVGMTMSGLFLVAYVTVMEMVGPKYRTVAASGITLSYVGGYIGIAGLAYFIPNWRRLQIAFAVPNIAFLVFSRYVPESVPWLLTKGRVQEAKDILEKAFVTNGVESSRDALDSLLEDRSKNITTDHEASMFDIFRYPNLRKKTLLLFSIWFVISLTYYGLSWNTSNLSGNDYLNFVFAAVAEIPAQAFVTFGVNRWGERSVLCGVVCSTGVLLLLTILVPTGMPWMVTALAMMGKFTIAVAYTTVYIFTSEQYPTAIRNLGVGTCSAVARIGAVVAPHLNQLFEISASLPLGILGSCAFVAGLVSLLLPETWNQKLPETIQDAEELGKNNRNSGPDMEQSIVDTNKPPHGKNGGM